MNELEIKHLDQMTEAIYNMLNGNPVLTINISRDLPDNEVRQLVMFLNKFIKEFIDMSKFINHLSKGDLDYVPIRGRSKILQDFKSLQSNLKHLTWKTQQISNGDFNQKLDFMGDFSNAFNKMSEQLQSSFDTIERQNKELKEVNDKLYQLSVRDSLTQIYNRHYIFEMLGKKLNRNLKSMTLSVSILDLDKFKRFNDTYGHSAGDYVLAETAKIMQQSVRDADTVGRYGGEEFVIVMPDTNSEEAYSIVERVRETIEKATYNYEDKDLSVTASFGVSSNEIRGCRTLEHIIYFADIALYVAKESGRNKSIIYDYSMEKKD